MVSSLYLHLHLAIEVTNFAQVHPRQLNGDWANALSGEDIANGMHLCVSCLPRDPFDFDVVRCGRCHQRVWVLWCAPSERRAKTVLLLAAAFSHSQQAIVSTGYATLVVIEWVVELECFGLLLWTGSHYHNLCTYKQHEKKDAGTCALVMGWVR